MKRPNERLFGSAVLALSIFVGLNFHSASHLLAPVALPALFVVATMSLAPLGRYSYAQITRIPPLIWRVIVWQQIILPTLVLFLGISANVDETLLLFALISATAGSLFAAPAIVSLLQLDNLQAFQGVVLSTLFTPVSLYIFMTINQGAHAEIDIVLFLERIFIFLVMPALIFYFYKLASDRVSAAVRSELEHHSRWIAIGALIVFGIAITDPVTYRLQNDPAQVLLYLLIATTIGTTMYVLTKWAFNRSGIKQSRTAAILTGFRNVGLSYGLIGDMVGDDFAVYVGVAMVPTFVVPFILNLAMSWGEVKTSDSRPAGHT